MNEQVLLTDRSKEAVSRAYKVYLGLRYKVPDDEALAEALNYLYNLMETKNWGTVASLLWVVLIKGNAS